MSGCELGSTDNVKTLVVCSAALSWPCDDFHIGRRRRRYRRRRPVRPR